MSEPRLLGLRVQILIALSVLMALAFAPLYGAVASLTRATLQASRVDAARALGRAIASHVAEVRQRGDAVAVSRTIQSHVGGTGAVAICVYSADGSLEATAGAEEELADIPVPRIPFGEATRVVRSAHGQALDVTVPGHDFAVKVRLRTDDDNARAAPLTRLFALYIGIFAIFLLVVAYFALTRLVVKPTEAIAQAADRVASGSRTFDMPAVPRARELYMLRSSLGAMTARLLANEEALKHKVAELTLTTRNLRDTRAELAGSERLASVGRLAAGIAHEIGNPITAIIGMQDLILEGDLSPETTRDFTERMRKETERMNDIIRDLLDFARPEQQAEAHSQEGAECNPAEAIDDVLGLVAPQKDFKGIEVRADLQASASRVRLSKQRLTQVLLNLLMNAKDALRTPRSETDTPAIDAAKGGATIVVRLRDEKNALTIEVEDNGPGIAASDAAEVFAPFFTTKEVRKGTGLGLSVCRGIVEGAGGTIQLDSTFMQGARFVIRFPTIET